MNRSTRFCRPLRNHSATWPSCTPQPGSPETGSPRRGAGYTGGDRAKQQYGDAGDASHGPQRSAHLRQARSLPRLCLSCLLSRCPSVPQVARGQLGQILPERTQRVISAQRQRVDAWCVAKIGKIGRGGRERHSRGEAPAPSRRSAPLARGALRASSGRKRAAATGALARCLKSSNGYRPTWRMPSRIRRRALVPGISVRLLRPSPIPDSPPQRNALRNPGISLGVTGPADDRPRHGAPHDGR